MRFRTSGRLFGYEESHATYPGCKHFGATIAIEIGERNTHALPRLCKTCVLSAHEDRARNFPRVARTDLIEKERNALTSDRPRRRVGPCIAIRKHQVQVAITIDIPHCDAATHGFRQKAITGRPGQSVHVYAPAATRRS